MYKILFFGTGSGCERIKGIIDNQKIKIMAYIDNDMKKQGNFIENKKIISVNEIEKFDYDYIIVTSQYYQEIRQQLFSLNVKAEKIIEFYKYNGFFPNSFLDASNEFVKDKKIYDIFSGSISYLRTGRDMDERN